HMIRTEVVTALGIRAIAGLSLGVSSTGGGSSVQSTVAVFAGQFLVLPDASATVATAPFEVSGGITRIKNAIIGTANIDTLNVAGYALSITLTASGVGTASISFTVPAGQIWRVSPDAYAGNGPTVTRNSASPYTAYLAITGGVTADTTSALIGGGGENGGGVYRAGGIVNKTTTDYPAGARTITATWSADINDGTPPTVNLSVRIEKRGA
ncbi:MAG: DUF1983 domain-containing protein, partial [Alphaproteobacteria bacterium]